ncbi:jg11675 [Pararge aegeria aegeria]|uniref:Jg11675 protein n=1 Tax=Pararge aegeria aegeria TaxID=348720 RepID=A0A8S4S588_9NEOP|nr:jg11675 [Pararge aegeria aegeria]
MVELVQRTLLFALRYIHLVVSYSREAHPNPRVVAASTYTHAPVVERRRRWMSFTTLRSNNYRQCVPTATNIQPSVHSVFAGEDEGPDF